VYTNILSFMYQLEHNCCLGFPVNVTEEQSLPPLVAVMLQPGCDHLKSRCVDMLLARGAGIEYTTM
jgi:hypothetical protein